MLGTGYFFGEGALAGQALRMGSAAAMTDCEIQRIDKKAMMDALHREPAFSELFVAYLLARNMRYEEDLVDQLFNSSEKRLARVLLLLAHFGKEGVPETVIPKISQESLAEMVGTTRSRVSFFMNRFRKLGFVNYSGGPEGGLQVHSSLLGVVHHIPIGPGEPDLRSTLTGIGLGMKSPIERVAVLPLQARAHGQLRHRCLRPVVRDPARDGEARPAVGAVEKGIEEAAVGRVRTRTTSLEDEAIFRLQCLLDAGACNPPHSEDLTPTRHP